MIKAKGRRQKAETKTVREPEARQHLADDELRPEPTRAAGWTCGDCGEPLTIAEHLGSGLFRRCDPEMAGRGNWDEVPEIEVEVEVAELAQRSSLADASREVIRNRQSKGSKANGNREGEAYSGLSTTTPTGIAVFDPDVVKAEGRGQKAEGPEKKLPEDWAIEIDPELRAAQRPLDKVELEKLCSDIIARGCLDPLIVWECDRGGLHKPGRILIDGHHRYQLCFEHRKPVAIVAMHFADRAEALAWVRDHQLGRRNLSPAERDELLAREYRAIAKPRGGARKKGEPGAKAQREPLTEKAEGRRQKAEKSAATKVAEKHGVSPATVKRAVQSQRDKAKIAEATGRTKAEIDVLSREDAAALAKLPEAEIKRAVAAGVKGVRKAIAKVESQKSGYREQGTDEGPIFKRADAGHAKTLIETHLARYPKAQQYQQSEFLLDAINAWRGQRSVFSGASAQPRRKAK